jgi:hypothetical protein
VAFQVFPEGAPVAWNTLTLAAPWTSVNVESKVAFAEPRFCELTEAHGAGPLVTPPQFLIVTANGTGLVTDAEPAATVVGETAAE